MHFKFGYGYIKIHALVIKKNRLQENRFNEQEQYITIFVELE